jgi:hypothetical protein
MPAWPVDMRRSSTVAPLEEPAVVGFKAGEGSIEHFPPWDDDHIVSGRGSLAPEHFSRQALCAVSNDGRPEFFRRRDAKPRRRPAIGHEKHRHEPAVNPHARGIRALEIRPVPDATGTPECLSVR